MRAKQQAYRSIYLVLPCNQSMINGQSFSFILFLPGDEGSGGGVRISCSVDPTGKPPGTASTIAEEAVDQLQENEKLVAG